MGKIRRRLEKLEGRAGGCEECRIIPGEGFRLRIYGLPPKPGGDPETYAPPGEKPREKCPACGRALPVIRLKGLERVMNLGKNRIEMRIPRSAWFPRDLRFPHS